MQQSGDHKSHKPECLVALCRALHCWPVDQKKLPKVGKVASLASILTHLAVSSRAEIFTV